MSTVCFSKYKTLLRLNMCLCVYFRNVPWKIDSLINRMDELSLTTNSHGKTWKSRDKAMHLFVFTDINTQIITLCMILKQRYLIWTYTMCDQRIDYKEFSVYTCQCGNEEHKVLWMENHIWTLVLTDNYALWRFVSRNTTY